jgi:aldehyde:ferredoxin oxidoreductase
LQIGRVEIIAIPNGYQGKILFVDLSVGKTWVENPDEKSYRSYLGGYGLGVHYLSRLIPPGADPLGEENVIAFLPGLLTGSGALFSGRFMIASLSPLTGRWGDSNCGGVFGPSLRGAGWDGVFILGQAIEPVYIFIDQEKIEIRSAAGFWGKDARGTEEAIRAECGQDVKTACIGPAGEKLSLISGIVNDDGRLAARCGLGAVMGAKKLKAVVVRGKTRPALADADRFKQVSAGYRKIFKRKPSAMSARVPRLMSFLLPIFRLMKSHPNGGPAEMVIDSYRRFGTAAGTAVSVELGDTPVRNWTGIGHKDFPLDLSEKLSDLAVVKPLVKPYGCHSCPVACGGIVNQPDGGRSHKPEYETLASFGPLLMNSSLDAVMRCNHICNMAGLDSISTGAVVAFALECSQNGWLPPELTSELSLEWGNEETIVELTRRIAARQPGLGDWLADGVQRALDRLPAAAHVACIHAGGQELAMHRGIYEPGVAAGYSFDPAPGRHTSTNSGNTSVEAFAPFFARTGIKQPERYDYEGKGTIQAVAMPLYRAYDALGLCHFALLMGNPPFLEWLNAATGWDFDEEEFLHVGRRIQVMRHVFNARRGLPAVLPLPGREMGDPPQKSGPVANSTLDMEAMAAGYFSTLGLDAKTGMPLQKTIEELGLDL